MASRVGKFLLFETLGEGSFGKVKLGVHEDNGERVAVKILKKDDIKANAMAPNVRREIAIMKALEHRNIVNLRQVLASPNKVYLVMDLVTGGELFTKIYTHGALSEPLARKYFQELVDGIAYCHSKGVIHRDLKPENILIDEATGTLKITDFGLSTMVTEGSLNKTLCGSPNYCAPEIILGRTGGYIGEKVDAWACGIVLFALLTGHLPFYTVTDDQKELYRIIATKQPKFPTDFPIEARDLVLQLLHKDPEKRVTVEAAKDHAWFKLAASEPKFTSFNQITQITRPEQAPRQYKFKPAAARTMKELKLTGLPPGDRKKRAIAKYNKTSLGERLQRVDDVLQRVFKLDGEAVRLPSEVKARDADRKQESIEAISVAEFVAINLNEQLNATIDKGDSEFTATDRELAAFEELVGMFIAHAASKNTYWWREIGDTREEHRRVKTLVDSLEPRLKEKLQAESQKQSSQGETGSNARSNVNGNGVANSRSPPTRPAQTPSPLRNSPITATTAPPVPPTNFKAPVNSSPVAQTPKAPVKPLVNGTTPVSSPPPGKPRSPSTDVRETAVVNAKLFTSGIQFRAPVTGSDAVSILARIITQKKLRVLRKKNEPRIKFTYPVSAGEPIQVNISGVDENHQCTLTMKTKKPLRPESQHARDLSNFATQLINLFRTEVADLKRASAAT